MMKGDRDYHDLCLKAEASRQEWESAVAKVSQGSARGQGSPSV